MKTILRHKFFFSVLALALCAWVFGPRATGVWLASHVKALIVGLVHFASGVFAAL